MSFVKKDIKNWKRQEYFDEYFNNCPCTLSVTMNIDITNLIENKTELYPTMLYLISSSVNKYEEFRTSLDKENNVIVFDKMYPSYTIFHKDTETFSSIWTEYNDNYETFLSNYNNDKENYEDVHKFNSKPNTPENVYNISMIPWMSFSGFNLNLQKGFKYLLPIFTMGKYFNQDNKIILPLSIQIHHAVCDGYHLSIFIEDLQKNINIWNLNIKQD